MKNVKEVAEKYSQAIWNDKNFDAIDQFVDSSAILHSSLGNFLGPKDMKKIVQTWLTGFPDLTVENLAILQNGDRVAIQWQAKGSHQGEFKGFAPTGKPISYGGVTIYRILNEKIIEFWTYLDMQHLINQLK